MAVPTRSGVSDRRRGKITETAMPRIGSAMKAASSGGPSQKPTAPTAPLAPANMEQPDRGAPIAKQSQAYPAGRQAGPERGGAPAREVAGHRPSDRQLRVGPIPGRRFEARAKQKQSRQDEQRSSIMRAESLLCRRRLDRITR